jgi:hypothetical protein
MPKTCEYCERPAKYNAPVRGGGRDDLCEEHLDDHVCPFRRDEVKEIKHERTNLDHQ